MCPLREKEFLCRSGATEYTKKARHSKYVGFRDPGRKWFIRFLRPLPRLIEESLLAARNTLRKPMVSDNGMDAFHFRSYSAGRDDGQRKNETPIERPHG